MVLDNHPMPLFGQLLYGKILLNHYSHSSGDGPTVFIFRLTEHTTQPNLEINMIHFYRTGHVNSAIKSLMDKSG